jgi:hypothetical protein
MKMTKKERDRAILVFAQHHHNPVGDIRGFNKVLFENVGIRTRKHTVAKLLRYI